jgi:hypothetical protein
MVHVFLQVSALQVGLCKTVGSAYVGSNPTPATHAKCQVSPGVSAGQALVTAAVCRPLPKWLRARFGQVSGLRASGVP